MEPIRWGILGTGSIANKMAEALHHLDEARLVAVGSRSREKADSFGAKHEIPRRHASYDDLANDGDVDIVYVATPHPMHVENAILCLNAGKGVLCEKPFAMNAGEARRMVEVARARKRFLMEAMWTRFLPLHMKIREMLAEGVIGKVRMVKADFSFRADFNPKSRLFAPELGGGGLLDVGCYVTSWARSIFKSDPTRIATMADIGATGVDEQAALVYGYEGEEMAVLTCAVRTNMPHEAFIFGEDGSIRIHHAFWHGTNLTLSVRGKEDVQMSIPFTGNGFECEAMEAMRCLRAGKTESAILPLDESIGIMETLDRVREDWGLKYPMEGPVVVRAASAAIRAGKKRASPHVRSAKKNSGNS